jgi:uncharacterized protein (TIGR02246 family)
MTSKASTLVAQAKQWASYYGSFTTGVEGAVLSVPLRFRGSWDRNDADAIADLFIENGSLLIGDEQLKGREAIREYMAAAFAGGLKGSQLVEQPVEIKLLTEDTAVAITEGGMVTNGGTEPDNQSRTMWVTTKRNGDWWLVSYQSSPVKG